MREEKDLLLKNPIAIDKNMVWRVIILFISIGIIGWSYNLYAETKMVQYHVEMHKKQIPIIQESLIETREQLLLQNKSIEFLMSEVSRRNNNTEDMLKQLIRSLDRMSDREMSNNLEDRLGKNGKPRS